MGKKRLKTCPFCGGKAKEVLQVGACYIKCIVCGCRTAELPCPDNRNAWNTRTIEKYGEDYYIG